MLKIYASPNINTLSMYSRYNSSISKTPVNNLSDTVATNSVADTVKPPQKKTHWFEYIGGTLLAGFILLSHYGYRIDRANIRKMAAVQAAELESPESTDRLFRAHWQEARVGYTWERIKHIIGLWPKLAINKLAGEPMLLSYEYKDGPTTKEGEATKTAIYSYRKQDNLD